MINIKRKEDCCGCYACENTCPKQCISMKIDNEGFWYPLVNKKLCIKCGLCEKVCPTINLLNKQSFSSIAYACKNKNEYIRKNSSSGGVFASLCEVVIKNKGTVFGVAFDENFEVKHTEAKTIENCKMFRGSKYVQSKIGDTYKNVREELDTGNIVLFSGTPCQVKGLNLFLGRTYKNLIVVDIACHGVPSPLVFKRYKESLEKKHNSKIKNINFRDKSYSWKNYRYKINFKNGEIENKKLNKNIYSIGFLNDLYLRPSCYNCKSKNFTSNSDILLADYWGIQNKHPQFDDDKGTSLILINSEKGLNIFKSILDQIEVIESDIKFAIENNPCIVRSVGYNNKREKFFEELESENLEKIIKKNTDIPFNLRFKLKSKKILSKIKKLY